MWLGTASHRMALLLASLRCCAACIEDHNCKSVPCAGRVRQLCTQNAHFVVLSAPLRQINGNRIPLTDNRIIEEVRDGGRGGRGADGVL